VGSTPAWLPTGLIHLDTSVLVDALTGPRRAAPTLRGFLERGERVSISTLVLYEWLRGPRHESELKHQEALFPADQAVPFGPREAAMAAHLYRAVPRARRREFDLGVAACALMNQATLWTLNAADYRDIPDLVLVGA
jgi:predicted nucleic acid-binding protein